MFQSRLAWIFHAACFLLFVSVPVFSQPTRSVSGCVEDQTHLPIPNANVTLTEPDNSTRFQTQTDGKGCFAIDAKTGRYQMQILAAGFSVFTKTITDESPVPIENIVLQLQPVEAAAVVTATRTLASTADVATSVDVIDREQVETSHNGIAADLLRNIAGTGVVQTANAGGLTSLFMRGGNSNYTKILVDGIPVNQPGGTYDFAHIATDNLSRMEVVRGPQSALYGSDAMTGVIQIFTRRGAGPPEADYTIEGGNYGTLKETAGTRGSWRKLDWSNTFGRSDTDNIKPNNDYRNASYFGNFGFTPDSRQALRGTLFHISTRTGTPGQEAPGYTSYTPNDYATNLERAAGLTYQVLAGPRLTQHFAYRFYDLNYNYVSHDYGPFPTAHTRHRAEYHGDLALPAAGILSYGVDFDRESADVSGTPHIRNNTGLYAQQQFEAWNRLNVVAGIRLDDNTTFGTKPNPRLGASYRLRPGTRLRFAAGTGVREPSFTENFSPSIYFLGNLNLVPERSRSWEAGVEQSFLSNRFTGSLTWFDNRFRNWIETVYQQNGDSQYQNIGRITAQGAEIQLRARIKRLSAQTSYTYLNGYIEQSSQASYPYRAGDPLIRRPKHSGDLVLTWIDRKWTARWATQGVGRRADTDFYAYTRPLTSNPGYSISNASFTYEFARPVSAFVRLNNVFNRDYQEVLGYLALGRSFVVGTRVSIGGAK